MMRELVTGDDAKGAHELLQPLAAVPSPAPSPRPSDGRGARGEGKGVGLGEGQGEGDLLKTTTHPFAPPIFALACCVLLLYATGCRTLAPKIPAVDLKAPGWTVREGQAVWTRPHGEKEIAGDVVVAWRDGSSFVQFSKSPFTLVVCQSTPQGWTIKIPVENLHYAGRGHAPKRIIWLQLPKVLAGGPPLKGWSWNMSPDKNWSLKNPKTGESIEGFFAE